MKRTTVWLLTTVLFLTLLGGCRTADKTGQTKPTDKGNTTTTTTHSEDHLASYITITSGDTTICPYSRITWERTDNGDGTYDEMIADHCDPDAPQNFARYENFFRLVMDKPNNQDGVVYPTVQLHPLYEKYPEYFDLDSMKGVEVYVWQMAGNLYYCGALSGTNRLKTEEEIQALFDNGATMEEMRTILELCEMDREHVSIIPVQNPLSSFWYEIDIEYAKQINALFWGE